MFESPAILFSSVVIGLLGMALLLYGKKQPDLKCLAAGVGFCVFPYFVHSLLLMWLITLAGCAGLWIARRSM